MAEFKDRLNEALTARDMSPAELSRITGVNEGAISQYRKGSYKASQRNLDKLAHALHVSIAWLMGADVDMENDYDNITNLSYMPKMKKIPLLGRIACGEPILTDENIEEYIDIPEHIHADFSLVCRGDSMTGARIYDGDIVYIRQQPDVENGTIAAVLIGDEATLKRVYKHPGRLILQPENPSFPPLVYVGNEIESVRIIGKAIAFTSLVKH